MTPDHIPAILTLTLNPALDLSSETPRIAPGHKLRCTEPRLDPGGGGINVSRLVARLGGDTTAFVALGGGTGMQLVAALQAERISTRIIPIGGETRRSLSVRDLTTGEQFRFMLPGPALTAAEYDAAVTALTEEAAAGDFVVISGSLPTCAAPDLINDIAHRLSEQGARLVIDTSGAALDHIVAHPPADGAIPEVLRFDHLEAEEAAGRFLSTKEDTARFAADLVARGIARRVVVGRQAEGNLLADATGIWFAQAATVTVISTIGAGDSFLAALTFVLASGASPAEALQWGTAAASAAVATPGTQICTPEAIEALLPECAVLPVAI
ncbi:Putative phosphofructokinase PfkB [Rhodobacteraceae bacterium THAF1]|uniref:1-phosphofructokinase family hexose kinase n=1 Tax=Palleronia sp. THAF1 TaxID=2587842 RepID=UPI000F3FCD53|nr:1-phosphofructokinase family hexose kinase [Palleronia sp. THAF1]QFU09642.1 Putative phosphofructokinase PfkB [Palleronia sp. THAF1]VDC17457.1 Putative phosphofructokinase PfkB [Rhodobacteraceae bacterium THAF1]